MVVSLYFTNYQNKLGMSLKNPEINQETASQVLYSEEQDDE